MAAKNKPASAPPAKQNSVRISGRTEIACFHRDCFQLVSTV